MNPASTGQFGKICAEDQKRYEMDLGYSTNTLLLKYQRDLMIKRSLLLQQPEKMYPW